MTKEQIGRFIDRHSAFLRVVEMYYRQGRSDESIALLMRHAPELPEGFSFGAFQ